MTQTSTSLSQTITETGGFTYSIATQSSPKAGDRKFAVAYSKDTEVTFPLATFTPSNLVDYIAEHAAELSQADVHLGAWVDGNLVYLDCSLVLEDEAEALRIARANDQLAIFCFETMTSRPVLRVVR